MLKRTPGEAGEERFFPRSRDELPFYRWWRTAIVGTVDHQRVIARIVEESGWSPRYIFMTMMSAGIAVLGLLLSSPAVVIGAMLISPLMGPILGLGFSLALFDFVELRRSLIALALGSLAAIVLTVVIVAASPLKAPTAEILARTRPNLFDLLVALFAALAGTFAIIRGRGETIVGVAIATALMPPLAVVGYGVATWNLPVLGGSIALFVTNFVTIALAATALARFYGFGHYLSSHQSWTQTGLLSLAFLAMAVPLALSLEQIAREAVTASQIRSYLSERFGSAARVTQLEVDFDAEPLAVRSVVIAPRSQAASTSDLQRELQLKLDRPVSLKVDQVLLDPGAGAIAAQRAELRRAADAVSAQDNLRVSALLAVAAGVPRENIILDQEQKKATAIAAALPGADLATYYELEQRAGRAVEQWSLSIVPPRVEFPLIEFEGESDGLTDEASLAVRTSAWAARRWNVPALAVPGLPRGEVEEQEPTLPARRALAVARLLRENGVGAIATSPDRQPFRLLIPEAAP